MAKNEIAESEVVEMEVELQVYDKVSADVDAAMEWCDKIVLCYDTPKDVAESKSWIFRNLRKLNAHIDHAHKEGKAEALKFTQAMDTKKNELREKVAEQIEKKYAPIKVIEDAEAKAKADEEAKIKAEEERIEAERLAEFEAAQKKLAEEQAELAVKQAEFERKERETRITEEAKKQVLTDAYRAAKQAGEDAENRRIADVQRAKNEAVETARIEAEVVFQKQAEEERLVMEEQRIAREKKAAEEMAETERINDEKHRSDVHRAIYVAMNTELHFNEQAENAVRPAQLITQALIDGKIPHTSIQY